MKINEEILNKQTWTLEDIMNRSRQLIKYIMKLYPYEESSFKVIAEKQYIFINSFIKAQAIFYDKNNIEVLAGSENVSYENKVNASCANSNVELFENLLEKGMLEKKMMILFILLKINYFLVLAGQPVLFCKVQEMDGIVGSIRMVQELMICLKYNE